MRPYIERVKDVVWESQICVQVLLSSANDDVEFIYLKPGRPYISREEYTARKLRAVGFVGFNGLKSLCAFAEPLPSPVVEAIARAFLTYTQVMLGENFVEHIAAAEVAELHRLFGLADPRMN